MREERKLIDTCPLRGVIDIVGKKWALLIIAVVGNKSSMRYNRIAQELVGISPKTLSDTLRGLQASGILRKEAFKEIPPRVEYSLTRDGSKLRESIIPLLKWAVDRSREKDCAVLKSALQTA